MDGNCESDLITGFSFGGIRENVSMLSGGRANEHSILDCVAQWNRIRGSSESRAGERLGSLNPIRELD